MSTSTSVVEVTSEGTLQNREAAEAVAALRELGYQLTHHETHSAIRAWFPSTLRVRIVGAISAFSPVDVDKIMALGEAIRPVDFQFLLGQTIVRAESRIEDEPTLAAVRTKAADTISILRAVEALQSVDEIVIPLGLEKYEAKAVSINGPEYRIDLTQMSVVDVATGREVGRATDISKYQEHYRDVLKLQGK